MTHGHAELICYPGLALLSQRAARYMAPLRYFAELLSPTFKDQNATISKEVGKITKAETHLSKQRI
jgi:hypothetical protein